MRRQPLTFATRWISFFDDIYSSCDIPGMDLWHSCLQLINQLTFDCPRKFMEIIFFFIYFQGNLERQPQLHSIGSLMTHANRTRGSSFDLPRFGKHNMRMWNVELNQRHLIALLALNKTEKILSRTIDNILTSFHAIYCGSFDVRSHTARWVGGWVRGDNRSGQVVSKFKFKRP